MKKFVSGLLIMLSMSNVFAFDYIPKDVDVNPFGDVKKNNEKVQKAAGQNVREIKNLSDYFKYLPLAVHKNWVPYKAGSSYEVAVQFRVNRDGSICEEQIVKSTNPSAHDSVLKAVRTGAPYRPLPASYPNEKGVMAQVILEYKK